MVRQFKDQYPSEQWCTTEPGCWQASEFPKELFAFSSGSVFRDHKYSRLANSIDFDSLENFRGGFVNALDYNWRDRFKDVKRGNMPYFVMYELSHPSVGSEICWKGHVFWEINLKKFEHLFNPSFNCRQIGSDDIDKNIFGISILKNEPLEMQLKLSNKLKISEVLIQVMSITGSQIILALGIRHNFRLLIIPVAIILLTMIAISNETVRSFSGYPILEGTNDSLLHESFGRDIFKHMLSGEINEGLRGEESVFYFMPGLRYFFAIEKFLFGDTSLAVPEK